MARTDLTIDEILQLKRWCRQLCAGDLKVEPRRLADYVERLTGEVTELRNREAYARHLHDLEGPY